MSQAKKLLVVDDEEAICDFICFVAEELGFEASFITETPHFEKVDICQFKIIFLDLAMPYLDGIELLQILTYNNYQGWLVLISGQDANLLEAAKVIAKSHGLNVLKTLAKPIGMNDLEILLTNLPTEKI